MQTDMRERGERERGGRGREGEREKERERERKRESGLYQATDSLFVEWHMVKNVI
jgi:hypothetical protein